MSRITRIEVDEFEFEAKHLARDGQAQTLTFKRGGSVGLAKYAIAIHTADGGRGEYVTHWVATRSSLARR